MALFADVSPPAPVAAGLFGRNQTNVAGDLFSAGKAFRSSDHQLEGQRRQRSDSGMGHQSPGHRSLLHFLVLAPWATRRRQDVLDLLDQLTPKIQELTHALEEIPVGSSSSPQAVTLKALSTASLSINQISVSGNFAQVNNCPSFLQGGQSCTIQVIFHPTVNKPVTGALAVSTAIGTASLAFSVALAGTVSGTVVSQIALQPAVLNFGNKGPDLVDSVKTVILTNTGSTSVVIANVSLTGSPNAVGAFPVYKINSNTCSGMLAPGAQCKIHVAFSTTFSNVFPQSYPAALTITDSDPTSPQVIGISGKQVAQLTLGTASITFPPQALGTTTTKTVTLTGHDLQNGLLLDMVTSGDFSASGDLSPCLLHLGGTCTMNITFSPKQLGAITGSVTIETYPECDPFPLHQCSDPVVLNLSGTGQ